MCELLEKAREKQGNISYWEMAKRLNVSDQVMNKWKNDKSKPNGLHALKLADMAEVTPKEAIRLMEGGFSSVSILALIAMTANAGLALKWTNLLCILCKIEVVLKKALLGRRVCHKPA